MMERFQGEVSPRVDVLEKAIERSGLYDQRQTSEDQVDQTTSSDPWKHRSQKMTCSTCMWFVVKSLPPITPQGPKTHALGRCRRHAPELGGFPAVFTTDWCGDHKLDETKLGDQ